MQIHYMKKIVSLFALGLISALNLCAGDLGTPAKPLVIEEWVKGAPVDIAAGKGTNIYVVEFWATWCPPCLASIPHLTELQKKFKSKNVIFVGVTDEKSKVVKKFVRKMAGKMDYTVAIDTGKTSEGYPGAFGLRGIPQAFIVDKAGNVVWNGRPMDGLEEALEQVLAGKYDLTKANAKFQKRLEAQTRRPEFEAKMQEYAEAMLASNAEKTKALEAEFKALDEEYDGFIEGERFNPAEFSKRVVFTQKLKQYQLLVTRGETKAATVVEKQIVADAPEGFDFKAWKARMERELEMQKANPVLQSYMASVSTNGDEAKAAEIAKAIEALELKNPELLNKVAEVILTGEVVKHRDLKLALSLSKRATDLSGSKSAPILATYARALFDNDKVADAITQQKKAIEAAGDDEDLATELKKSLETYEAKASAK
jgi:thiol-disulfide isomerase/thioredoxin